MLGERPHKRDHIVTFQNHFQKVWEIYIDVYVQYIDLLYTLKHKYEQAYI